LRWTVSRILFPSLEAKPRAKETIISLRRVSPRASGEQARHETYPRIVTPRAGAVRIFGLAAGGVCHAGDVTTAAVRSYRTISPLLEEMQNDE